MSHLIIDQEITEKFKKKNALRVQVISNIISNHLGQETKNMSILDYDCNTGWGVCKFSSMGSQLSHER